ncbi:MAG: thioredoxin family protein [Campylobacteraceae bacterium 4484_166]|nr:MAG: thioredoxin family protein [Campylobacteraceae bacterium 4484_166]
MKIEILGTGCAKCKALENNVKEALSKIGGFHSIEKVDDIVKIMEYEVMSTPGLVIDSVVKSSGKLLSVDDIVNIINENKI